jgi:hypothetical protein
MGVVMLHGEILSTRALNVKQFNAQHVTWITATMKERHVRKLLFSRKLRSTLILNFYVVSKTERYSCARIVKHLPFGPKGVTTWIAVLETSDHSPVTGVGYVATVSSTSAPMCTNISERDHTYATFWPLSI